MTGDERSPNARPVRTWLRHWWWIAVGGSTAVALVVGGVVLLADNADLESGGLTAPYSSEAEAPTQPPTSSSRPPSSSPPGDAAVPPDHYVALLEDGRIAAVSAADGSIVRVLGTVPVGTKGAVGDLAISGDRRAVFFAVSALDDENGCRSEVRRLDLTTGNSEPVVTGTNPQLSPDGRRLAVMRNCEPGAAVVVVDLATGLSTELAHVESVEDAVDVPWVFTDVAWDAGGSALWVVMEWEGSTELRRVDPTNTGDLSDGQVARTEYATLIIEPRGDGLVYHHECCYPDFAEPGLVVTRSPNGTEQVLLGDGLGSVSDLQAGPSGELLTVVGGRVFRIEPTSGQRADLGPSTALARDW